MNKLIILGLILSCSAFMETARVYGISSFVGRQLIEVGSYENKFNLNLAELAKDSKCSSDVIKTVTDRNNALGEAQMERIGLQNAITHNALIQGVLWLLTILVFAILLLKEKARKLDSINATE